MELKEVPKINRVEEDQYEKGLLSSSEVCARKITENYNTAETIKKIDINSIEISENDVPDWLRNSFWYSLDLCGRCMKQLILAGLIDECTKQIWKYTEQIYKNATCEEMANESQDSVFKEIDELNKALSEDDKE